MSTQGGLKHAATEPSHLDNKRDVRRRGAEGRAAALRRAPSDSDCSGETASLSADSAERLRPVLPPPRANKTRSRRRGSEWEVLEGLKDGQRFERRPEVFNGYLHKKRKWPLKGWHKRFFVIDGGILVYARSPADVARGRLHGSVDVGLSVISAKARRRRIDIDADEFIYHLRAKTPDVFRTWLNVLKVHRLYRQHLLTFGARESVPKIHAPMDDLPPTDTSSRVSSSILLTSESSSQELLRFNEPEITPVFSQNISCYNHTPVYYNTNQNPMNIWLNNDVDHTECSEVMPLIFEPLEEDKLYISPENLYHHSLCSMKCMTKRYEKDFDELKRNGSVRVSEAEKQIDCTELDKNSLKTKESSMLTYSFYSTNFDNVKDKVIKPVLTVFDEVNESFDSTKSEDSTNKLSQFFGKKIEPTAAFFLFGRKKKILRPNSSDAPMKRSNKSTNLVKYRNVTDEPPLKKPLSRSMLLKKYKTKVSKLIDHDKVVSTVNDEVQVVIENENKENKSLQDVMTTSEYDRIAEKLITNIFDTKCTTSRSSGGHNIQYYVTHMVRELYDVKFTQTEVHPVKMLFRCLLEYWLKNSSAEKVKDALKSAKSINIQSKNHFSKDQNLSSLLINNITKHTQFHGFNFSKVIDSKQTDKKRQGCPNQALNHSVMKERRIQELERLLKSTVYTCDTLCSDRSKEKDIAITKKLIDNLENLSRKSDDSNNNKGTKDNSNSSTEFPEIQATFNHLISETAIPPGIAKEFLGAYLDMLLDHSSTPVDTQTSDESKDSNLIPDCDVQTESVLKKVSKGVLTADKNANENVNSKIRPAVTNEDPGQKYLKDILDKITAVFSKVKKSNKSSQDKDVQPDDMKVEESLKSEGGGKDYPDNALISENNENNSIVIDLTKYDLEHISMISDPSTRGVMSITIKLKERPPDFGESNQKNLNLKFTEHTEKTNCMKHIEYISNNNSSTKYYLKASIEPRNSLNPFIDYDSKQREEIELKPYLSTSDATSKAYKVLYESQNSLNGSVRNDNLVENFSDSKKSFECHDDPQSCYILSSVKKSALASGFQLKNKARVKECDEILLSSDEQAGKSTNPTPKVIDEFFLLLLLENLTLLSQNVPGLHKDINSLYIKLKKKHDKDLRNAANPGLGFLGKIYNEESKAIEENATQFDANVFNENPLVIKCSKKEIGVNTSTNLVGSKSQIDRATSVSLQVSELKAFDTQTEEKYTGNKNYVDNHSSMTNNLHVVKDNIYKSEMKLNPSVKIVDMKVSNINRCAKLCTKDYGNTTILKGFMDNNSCQNFNFVPDDKQNKSKTKNPSNVRYKSTKEMTNYDRELWLSSSQNFPEATQSIKIKKMLKEKKLRKDFNVYQIFVSNKFRPNISSSLSGSNVEVKSDDLKTIYRCTSDASYCSESGGPLESASRSLGQAQLSVQQLQRLLDALDLHHHHPHPHHHDTDQVSLEGASPNVKKDRRKFGLRKKKSGSKCASVDLAPHHHPDASASHMALSALTAPPSPGGGASSAPNSAASLPIACAAARPQSLPGTEALGGGPASLSSLTPDHQLREDFTVLAKDLVSTLKGVVSTLVCERGRLRAAMDAADSGPGHSPAGAVLAALRTNLSSALQQNSELRSRLSRIHDASDLAEISSVNNTDPVNRPFHQSLSYSSSCVSASEFFDAEELVDQQQDILPADEAGVIELDGDSSSEAGSLSSEEGSVASSDNSDGALLTTEPVTVRLNNGCSRAEVEGWTRRTRLPCPRPTPGGPSLWNLLYKNIGKDLSQVSMPVTINEPLNMLQRLCEELEYSELLDAASSSTGSIDRMSLVAAFAVSAYAASAHRAASKPFNPLLAETYECVRSDRGFRFLAEQVSHHPPISACHAESSRWIVWQEARIKTKFWGKSMEFQPAGRVHVRLLPQGDHYSWNKVTTCVHNLFGGQRWVDQYGDMHIVCHGTDIAAKLNFIKASSWSSSRHEVRGFVTEGGGGGARLRLQGRWSEALHAGEPPAARCLWRPGAMPPEHELYYGFTRFAMELNEMEPGLKEVLPPTDTRLRPDQRALEEGDVDAAEQHKHDLEQAQRDRRRHSPEHTPCWFRKSVEDGEEMWVFTGEYWRVREEGFSHQPRLW